MLNTYRKQQCSVYSEELKSGKGNRICRNLNYESVYLQMNDKKRSLSGTQFYQISIITIGLRDRCYKPRHMSVHTGTSFYSEGMLHTGCPRRNVPDFGRVFLMLKYRDITQKTYVQSWTVTEIMAREKCGLLAGPRTVPVSWQSYPCPSLSVVSYDGNSAHTSPKLHMYFLQGDDIVSHVTSVLGIHVSCIVLGTLRTTMTWVQVFL